MVEGEDLNINGNDVSLKYCREFILINISDEFRFDFNSTTNSTIIKPRLHYAQFLVRYGRIKLVPVPFFWFLDYLFR